MKIEVDEFSNNTSGGSKKKIFLHIKKWSGYLLLFSALSLSFVLGGVAHKEGYFGQVFKVIIKEHINIPIHYVRSLFTTPENISLDIKHINFQKLAYKREQAMESGVLHSSREDFVPAKLRWNGNNIKAEVRLKGDLSDHWEDKTKWSFRVKTKKGKTLLGMNEFSLQHPKTRGTMNDWFLHRILNKLGGFIILRYEFVNLTLNGKNLGIYLLEEHFDDKLLENNNYVKAPIVRFYDHLLWYGVDPKIGFSKEHLNEHYTISPIDMFNTRSVYRDPVQMGYFNKAKNLLESFRTGKLSTSEVFNTKKLAQLFAVIDLFGYHHSTAYSNIRFYYNPITGVLDPIGYDNTFIYKATYLEGEGKEVAGGNSGISEYIDHEKEEMWYSALFKDAVFFKKYVEQLEYISQESFLDSFFSEIESEYQDTLDIIYNTFPGYRFDYRDTLYSNQKYIQTVLSPKQAVESYFYSFDKSTRELAVNVGNIHSLPIEVNGVFCNSNGFSNVKKRTILQPKKKLRFIEYQLVKFKLPDSCEWSDTTKDSLDLVYSIIGSKKQIRTKITPWKYLDKNTDLSNFAQIKSSYGIYPFFQKNSNNNTLNVESGVWEIHQSIFIPEGLTLNIEKGTTIKLLNGARLVSYSPIRLNGTRDAPIILQPSDGLGSGIIVTGPKEKSVIKNLVVRGQSKSKKASQGMITSPLVFYDTKTSLENVIVDSCSTESAVYFVRTEFNVDSLYITKCKNGITATFSNGIMSKVTIDEIDGNGVVLSNSSILADNFATDRINGFAIKTMESSTIELNSYTCRHTKVCLVATTSSIVNAQGVGISDSNIGVAVYTEEDLSLHHGVVDIDGVDFVKVNKKYLVEDDSSLILNKLPITNIEPDVLSTISQR